MRRIAVLAAVALALLLAALVDFNGDGFDPLAVGAPARTRPPAPSTSSTAPGPG
jgi:hypothetical protein